ncbi:MbtH protein [Dyella sp. OK004]|uniref:MbtH family protein n=1 Tax=Dyella sp. OK004 TaxID=1855292 RepID=UPI0008E52833|nr:MbtH family NRPS accessory protein [Dyella sp. OK004]SFS13665.1 MbtH protein [Dyella sp. OK004]
MSTGSRSSETLYEVVVNRDGQYSTWPVFKVLPQGWAKAGKQGAKAACLEFIGTAWTDMRPTSLGASVRR